jgi:hypothetical protein
LARRANANPLRLSNPIRARSNGQSGINQTRAKTCLPSDYPHDVKARLEALAKATGRTQTYYVREAILEHLDVWKTCTLPSND